MSSDMLQSAIVPALGSCTVCYPSAWRTAQPDRRRGAALDVELERWGLANGLLDSKSLASFLSLDLDSFVRCTFAGCEDEELLRAAARYTLWLFRTDDVLERITATGDRAEAERVLAPCRAVLCDPERPTTDLAAGIFAGLTRTLVRRGGESFLAKWRRSHERYWSAALGAELCARPQRTLEQDVASRPFASGVAIYFDLGELLAGSAIPLSLSLDPETERLQTLAALAGGAFNDVLSYERERALPNVINLAASLRKRFSLDDARALSYASALHDMAVREFDRRADAQTLPSLARYATVVRSVVYGLARWQLRSRRYRGGTRVTLRELPANHPVEPEHAAVMAALLER
jgi:hypothetical protein